MRTMNGADRVAMAGQSISNFDLPPCFLGLELRDILLFEQSEQLIHHPNTSVFG